MNITLLSDLGMRDAAVPVAKAILLEHAPEAVITDISHCVARDDVQQAAYLLQSAGKAFEKGSVHIVAVDIFAGATPRMLVVKKDGSYVIAPDNGLLPLAYGAELDSVRQCFEYSKPYSFDVWMRDAGTVVATLTQGWVLPYKQCQAGSVPHVRHYQVTPYGLECSILYIDRYKNVVVDITQKQFEKAIGGKAFIIKMMAKDGLVREIKTISVQYNDVEPDKPLCRFNRAGYLEVCINHGDAAAALGLEQVAAGDLKYRVLRVFF